jgi:hypothetical protein
MDDHQLWNGFVAAMLHDIGKVILNEAGSWGHHEDLDHPEKIKLLREATGLASFRDLLGEEVVDLIKAHHGYEKRFELSEMSAESLALSVADRIESAMYQIDEKREEFKSKEFQRLRSRLQFYPFYRYPMRWDQAAANVRAREAIGKLAGNGRGIDIRRLLDFQESLLDYPHISYIPHASLAVHHRLVAVLYLLLVPVLKTMPDPTHLDTFSFYVLQVEPQHMGLFYRLRDVQAHKKITWQLATRIFTKPFPDYKKWLAGFNPAANPFVFYHGDGIVFVHDDRTKALTALQECVDEIEGLRSLRVDVHSYVIPLKWCPQDDGTYKIYAPPDKVVSDSETVSVVSREAMDHPRVGERRCQACGMLTHELKADDKGNHLCLACFVLRKQFSSGLDIDRVAELPDGGKTRLAYVFLTLPEDLLSHTQEVARDSLIASFADENRIAPLLITPSQTGLLEYLQALMELAAFEATLDHEGKPKGTIQEIAKDTLSANAVFTLPSLKLYLLWEDKLWDFWRTLNARRLTLRLETGVKVALCDYKTPFWSLMDGLVRHSKGDMLYDIGKEVITVFTSEEVRKIRELADRANRDRVYRTQLQQIAQVALQTSKDELLLEIDTRARWLRGFQKPLKEALENLSEEGKDFKDREKRSVFIKYIAKLIR